MNVRQLRLAGAWEITPTLHGDERGHFFEAFSQPQLHDQTGIDFTVAQTNVSVSKLGTIRGIHYSDVPPGQAKYVQCLRGTVLDVLIDLREGSSTFGQWAAVELSGDECNAVHIPIGFGHAFQALTDHATVMYLCSTPYNPASEHGIDPLDAELNLPWQTGLPVLLSDKDAAAPDWPTVRASGRLPRLADCPGFGA